MAEEIKNRYSDEELAEFRAIIEEKLAAAKAEYKTLREIVMNSSTNDIEDTSPSFKTVEDAKAAIGTVVSAGDTVLLKASHSMNLGSLI